VSEERDPLWLELRAAIDKADPVPPEVLRAARQAFARRPVDAGPVSRRRGLRASLLARCRYGPGGR
jgi:hypothetical protein